MDYERTEIDTEFFSLSPSRTLLYYVILFCSRSFSLSSFSFDHTIISKRNFTLGRNFAYTNPHPIYIYIYIYLYTHKVVVFVFGKEARTVKTWISINAFWWDCLSGGIQCETTCYTYRCTHTRHYMPFAISLYFYSGKITTDREHTFYFGL